MTTMETTSMTNPNVIVARAADPPGFFPNYASKWSLILGGTQIAMGCVIWLIFVLALSVATFGAHTSRGYAIFELFAGIAVSINNYI